MNSIDFLDGVRVVTMAQNLPGPLAAARLRAAGARVIKIEPPAGDPLIALSPDWHAELHAEIAIERLDLRTTEGRSRMMTFLADADVFIASHRPSALAALGLDPETLRRDVPGLRMVRIVGSARDPERPGHDLTYQAQAGLLADVMPRTLTADVMASERAFSATLAVLRMPGGSVMDVGLVESLEPMLASLRNGLTLPSGILGGAAPRYRLYATRDGHVAVAALEPHFERRLYEQLGAPSQSDLTSRMLERTAAEWEGWAEEHDLPIAVVRHVGQATTNDARRATDSADSFQP